MTSLVLVVKQGVLAFEEFATLRTAPCVAICLYVIRKSFQIVKLATASAAKDHGCLDAGGRGLSDARNGITERANI